MNKFVIVGGLPRSGTNLVRRIVGSHSEIAMPPVEFKFFPRLAQGRSVKEILEDDSFRNRYPIDVTDLYQADPNDAYRTLLCRYADYVGKSIGGEKTPNNEFHFPAIRAALTGSELRFVQVVRNPLDVAASYKHAPFRKNVRQDNLNDEFVSLAVQWTRSVSLGAIRATIDPEHYYFVKFEDLTSDASTSVERLCRFLGVGFERDRMLNLSDYAEHQDNTSFSADGSATVPSEGRVRIVESRKGHLADQEVRHVAEICGEFALALGYDDDEFVAGKSRTRLRRSTVSSVKQMAIKAAGMTLNLAKRMTAR